jgi:hypothetical protein
MSEIKFMQHAIRRGPKKARIHYSIDNRTDRRPVVTLYAKDHEAGEALARILPEAYENKTDSSSDYFDKGTVRLFEDHPLYRQARKAALEAEWANRSARRKRTLHARSR